MRRSFAWTPLRDFGAISVSRDRGWDFEIFEASFGQFTTAMTTDLKVLALTPQENANLRIIGQNSAQAQQERTFSACFSHLANLEQVLSTFQTWSDPFATAPAAPKLAPQ
jgi:hypothetical protein